jgi:hypothetical protein
MDALMAMLTDFRVCWISGRWGGGKTSLAVHLALESVKQGRTSRIVTNLHLLNLGVEPIKISADDVPQVEQSVIVIDEAWQYLAAGQWKKSNDWLAYVRKRKQVLLLPSVANLTGAVRTLEIFRVFNAIPWGLPAWWYFYTITDKKRNKGKPMISRFTWWRPSKIFDYYDNRQEPDEGVFYVYDFGQASEDNSGAIEASTGD